MEIAVAGHNDEISEKIEEMKESLAELDFERFMEAFEELESARRMQIDELVREFIWPTPKPPEKPLEKVDSPQPEDDVFKKRIPIATAIDPMMGFPQQIAHPQKVGGKLHPAIPIIGLLTLLVAAFIGMMMKVAAGNKPAPKTGHELYLEQKAERERPARTWDDDGRDIRGPQDNRGHSDQ